LRGRVEDFDVGNRVLENALAVAAGDEDLAPLPGIAEAIASSRGVII
jgi:hypothetical protein